MARRLLRLPRLLPSLSFASKPCRFSQPSNPNPGPLLSSSPPAPPPPPLPRGLVFPPRLFSSPKPYRFSRSLSSNPNPRSLLPSSPPSSSPPPLPRGLFLPARHFSSSGGSNMVVVGSSDAFGKLLSKVEDEKLAAIFYYTATWCGPCRVIAPVIEKLSEKYPIVPVYKVDIDMEGLGSTLGKLKIYSVPTFHFYQNGQKANEVVGADVKNLEATMENLYK